MAVSAANVKVATTGKVWLAPFGTALPTGTQATPNVAFKQLGYIDENGVTESQGNSTNKIKAWQNGDTVRVVQTEHDLTYHFTAEETNPTVLAAFYGNYTAGVTEINALLPPTQPWIIDAVDDVDVVRIVIPYAQLTAKGDRHFVSGDALKYDFTITAYADPAYAGGLSAPAKAYQYLYDVSMGVSA